MRPPGRPPTIAIVTSHRWAAGQGAAVLAAVALLSACGSARAQERQAAAHAEQLVSSAQAAGVAPGLTVDVAESLYGSSAPQVCDALDGGVSSAESMLLTLNPAGRRPKVISTDAVTYGGLVVQTYCPQDSATYDELVSGMDPVETTG
jgi:hypothetical protein